MTKEHSKVADHPVEVLEKAGVLARARQKLLAERQTGIGGSDVGAILGLDPYRTKFDVWLEKTGQIPAPLPPNKAMQRGIYLEPVALALYAEQTGHRVGRRHRFLRHPVERALLCHLDAWVDEGAGKPIVAEVKCPGLPMLAAWKRDGVPPRYVAQMQHALAVSGAAEGVFILFNAEHWELISFKVPNERSVTDWLVQELGRFWRDHVLTRRPPEQTEPDVISNLPVVAGDLQTLPDTLVAAVQGYDEARDLEALAKAVKDDQRAALLKLGVGRHQGGGFRVTVSQVAGRVTLDTAQLERAQPMDPRKLPEGVLTPEQVAAARLDLDQFRRTGAPFAQIHVHRLKEE